MKHIFTLLLILSFASAYSQFSAGMHVGGSNKDLITGLNTQYQFKNNFTFGFNLTAHVDGSNPVFLQSRFGYTMGETGKGVSFEPYLGYSYGIQNFEQKNYGGHVTGGLQIRYQFSKIAAVYTDINFPAPKYTMFSIGISGIIPRNCD